VRLDADGVAASGDGGRDAEILRIAEEALHNAVRHAAADRVAVRMRGDDHGLSVEVADDGIGFDPSDPELRSRHLGLTSMEERARELGGRLTLRSQPGEGTVVRLEVPARAR
jgi:signal transduction histidine kinase